MMEAILAAPQQLRLWRTLDVQFAFMLATPLEDAQMLASACLISDAAVHCTCRWRY